MADDRGGLPRSARDVVLASASPRRLDLLRLVGLEPVVRPADIDETPRPDEQPLAYVARLSVEKAHRQRRDPGDIVVAADTAVVLDGSPLGKPDDLATARGMLRRLAGRAHVVVTGVAVIGTDGRLRSDVVTTTVHMAELSAGRIDWYLGTHEPLGKAGGYAIQGRGAALVRAIEGSWTNVVGLPLSETVDLLADAGISVPR